MLSALQALGAFLNAASTGGAVRDARLSRASFAYGMTVVDAVELTELLDHASGSELGAPRARLADWANAAAQVATSAATSAVRAKAVCRVLRIAFMPAPKVAIATMTLRERAQSHKQHCQKGAIPDVRKVVCDGQHSVTPRLARGSISQPGSRARDRQTHLFRRGATDVISQRGRSFWRQDGVNIFSDERGKSLQFAKRQRFQRAL